MSAITKYLPKRSLSRLAGRLMHWQGPFIWAYVTIHLFAWFYKIDTKAAEKPMSEYKSIGDFFVRKLKPHLRPVANSWAVHPADSRITQCSQIVSGKLIQAKGIFYDVHEFTREPEALKKWQDGTFITYYLCPTDYHRVHSPVEGQITSVRHIFGELWPVNEWSTQNVPELFAVNERILVEIETELGPVALVFVGATNVGHILLSFDHHFKGNQVDRVPPGMEEKKYESTIAVQKGEELGMFRMGSTVVMIYPKAFTEKHFQELKVNPSVVRFGEALTKF